MVCQAAARCRSGSRGLFLYVTMDNLGGNHAVLPHGLLDRFRHHHRAMLSAGAAKRNSQITLAFADVVRDEISKQALDAPQKFSRLRERTNVAPDFRIFA